MQVIYTIWLRNVKRYIRSKSRIIGSLGMPLFFLLVMGFGLNSVLKLPGGGETYIKYIIPGVVSMSVFFTSMFSGIQIIWDKQFGFLKETLVAPVSRIKIMIGQTIGGATTSLIQGLLILIISLFVVGFLSNISGFLIAIFFMVLIGISFTAFGIAIASKMDDMQGFQLIMNFIIFPIIGLSGAFFPLDNLPIWLKTLTMLDPLTYGVEGVRYGLLGTSHILPIFSLIFMSTFAIIMIIIGALLFNKLEV
jgi:ABC-2 type transport system permease protein